MAATFSHSSIENIALESIDIDEILRTVGEEFQEKMSPEEISSMIDMIRILMRNGTIQTTSRNSLKSKASRYFIRFCSNIKRANIDSRNRYMMKSGSHYRVDEAGYMYTPHIVVREDEIYSLVINIIQSYEIYTQEAVEIIAQQFIDQFAITPITEEEIIRETTDCIEKNICDIWNNIQKCITHNLILMTLDSLIY